MKVSREGIPVEGTAGARGWRWGQAYRTVRKQGPAWWRLVHSVSGEGGGGLPFILSMTASQGQGDGKRESHLI